MYRYVRVGRTEVSNSHSSKWEHFSCWIASGGDKRSVIFFLSMFQICSVGFKSVEHVGQSIQKISSWKIKSFTVWSGVIIYKKEFIPDCSRVKGHIKSKNPSLHRWSIQWSILDDVHFGMAIYRYQLTPSLNLPEIWLFRAQMLDYFECHVFAKLLAPNIRLYIKVVLVGEENVAPFIISLNEFLFFYLLRATICKC